MKKWMVWMLSVGLILSLAACGGTPEETQPTEAKAAIANPYGTYETAQEMQQAAGLEVQLPAELPSWITETIYRAIPGELVEVIYKNETNEIRVRIKNGDQDISGVYDADTKEEKDVVLGENSVHLKGETTENSEFTAFVGTWVTAEGRTYSVTSPEGIPEQVMLDVIAQIH